MKDHSPILKRNLTGCVAAVLLILFDQFTKMLAVAHLKNQPSNVLIDGVFELRYLENRGSAFGMMQNKLIIQRGCRTVFCRSHREFHRPRQTGLCGRFFLFQPDQFSDL